MNPEFKPNQRVFVHRPDQTFSGIVINSSQTPGWLRVAGEGSIKDTIFYEWFPIKSTRVYVTPA